MFKKIKEYLIVAVLFFVLVDSCNTCTVRRQLTASQQSIDSLQNVISNVYSKKQLDKKLEIMSLEQERSTLYNENNIVLKNVRPEDRINQIDERLKELQKQ